VVKVRVLPIAVVRVPAVSLVDMVTFAPAGFETLSPMDGTCPVDQSLGVLQSPTPPIQLTVESNNRVSKRSIIVAGMSASALRRSFRFTRTIWKFPLVENRDLKDDILLSRGGLKAATVGRVDGRSKAASVSVICIHHSAACSQASLSAGAVFPAFPPPRSLPAVSLAARSLRR
jgi:hypothetical protein